MDLTTRQEKSIPMKSNRSLYQILIFASVLSFFSYCFYVHFRIEYNKGFIEAADNDLRMNEITAKIKSQIIQLRMNGGVPKNLENEIDSVILLSHNYAVRLKDEPSLQLNFSNPEFLYEKLDAIGMLYDMYYWDELEWFKDVQKFRLIDPIELRLLIPINKYLSDYRELDNQSSYIYGNINLAEESFLTFGIVCVASILLVFSMVVVLIKRLVVK